MSMVVCPAVQAASSCVFCEYSWTPGDMVQAEDRCHRIGQRCSVNVTFLHARHSVDDHIWTAIAAKLSAVGRVGRLPRHLTSTHLIWLIQSGPLWSDLPALLSPAYGVL